MELREAAQAAEEDRRQEPRRRPSLYPPTFAGRLTVDETLSIEEEKALAERRRRLILRESWRRVRYRG